MNLFVAGLPYDLDDAELMEIFEKFGAVTSAKVAMDKETGKSRGFAFVEMPNEAEAKDAIENLNDISLGKKPLVVKQAEERSSGGGGGNRGGAPGGNRGGAPGGNRGGAPGGGFNNRPGNRDNNRDRNRY
ncbi:MAG: RNA-binding protein [Chitinophagaceae bacterium]|nr:MAG: RNA-binding protein [Chitinophagaceae bacterium]